MIRWNSGILVTVGAVELKTSCWRLRFFAASWNRNSSSLNKFLSSSNLWQRAGQLFPVDSIRIFYFRLGWRKGVQNNNEISAHSWSWSLVVKEKELLLKKTEMWMLRWILGVWLKFKNKSENIRYEGKGGMYQWYGAWNYVTRVWSPEVDREKPRGNMKAKHRDIEAEE